MHPGRHDDGLGQTRTLSAGMGPLAGGLLETLAVTVTAIRVGPAPTESGAGPGPPPDAELAGRAAAATVLP
jgi:hypothetical protein